MECIKTWQDSPPCTGSLSQRPNESPNCSNQDKTGSRKWDRSRSVYARLNRAQAQILKKQTAKLHSRRPAFYKKGAKFSKVQQSEARVRQHQRQIMADSTGPIRQQPDFGENPHIVTQSDATCCRVILICCLFVYRS